MSMEAPKGVDADKWRDCVKKVKARGDTDNAYAICTASMKHMTKHAGKKGKEWEAELEKAIDEAMEAHGSTHHGANLRAKKPLTASTSHKLPGHSGRLHVPKAKTPHVRHKQSACREKVFRIREAQQDDNDRLFFPVDIIAEGLGNLKDKNYYLPSAIQSGVQAYEGAQAYYDHPSPQEEQQQPNRTVNELLGHYEDCKAVKGSDGLMYLQAKLFLIEGISRAAAKDVIEHAVIYSKKYPDKDFIGLSINGDGEGEACDYEEFISKYSPPPAALEKLKKIEGQQVNAISKLTDAFSADLVTAAGAGGKVKTQESKEKQKMKFVEGFKKFWSAVENKKYDVAEAAVKDMLQSEDEDEKKEADKKAEADNVKGMLNAMKCAQKEVGEKKEDEDDKEYESRMEKALKAAFVKQAKQDEDDKKEAADKADEKKEGKDKEDEDEKKEGADDDKDGKGGDDDKDAKDKKDGDDDDDSKEKKEGEDEDDDSDDDDDKDHPDADKDKKLIAKVMKKHLSLAKQMQAMNEKMESMSKELEKHEKESKQSKKESAEARTVLAIKAREELIDKELSKSGYPMRITKLWRPALESCKNEKEIGEMVKSLMEAAAQANAERFYIESSRGLLEKAVEESGNNSDLFLKS